MCSKSKRVWVREGLEQTPPRGSVTTTLLVHGTILVRQAIKNKKRRVLARFRLLVAGDRLTRILTICMLTYC